MRNSLGSPNCQKFMKVLVTGGAKEVEADMPVDFYACVLSVAPQVCRERMKFSFVGLEDLL